MLAIDTSPDDRNPITLRGRLAEIPEALVRQFEAAEMAYQEAEVKLRAAIEAGQATGNRKRE